MFGIPDFNPRLIHSTQELKSVHGQALARLLGQTIERTWVLWNHYSDSWWTEWPVILKINGKQLEVFVWDMDKIGLTWDAIDVTAPLYEGSDGAGDYLEWREDALPELIQVRGQRIREISAVEYRFSMNVLRDPQDPALVGKQINFGWLLNAIEFRLDKGYLSIENNLSGCGVSNSPMKGPDFRRKVIARRLRFFGN